MPPKRKAKAAPTTEAALDPSLVPPPQDDNQPAAGPSKRAKTTGKAKTPAMSAERKEANRLAAERSRVRRATRASILEQTAKGLAEENLVLKERIKKLVAMGVSVEAERTVEEPKVADKEPSLGPIATPRVSASPMELSIPARTGKSSLHHEMETHFRQQMDELRHVLHEKRQQLASDELPEMNDISTQQHQIEFFNTQLLAEVRILRDAVVRVRADQARAKAVNDRLRKRIQEAEEQLLVNDGVADAGFRVEERRSEVQRAFKDVKRHLGLLIGHFHPGFIEPDLPEQEAFVVPAPYESAPLPEPQKRGRPPLAKKGSQSKSTRKYTGPVIDSHHHEHAPAEASSSTPRPNRSKKRYEPSKVRYRLDADPDVIYIEEREIIQNEDGEQEIVHISKKPVYNPRPRSGAGRKPSASKMLAGEKSEVDMSRDDLERMTEAGEMAVFSPSMEPEGSMMDASFAETVVGHRTLHEAEAERTV
ncbi:hypothetical protein NliqN6_1270 [Naganishia liquefaciens]|uniref:BZIP domain-containing protein n=1 Tax=Naganishia liquefaciens TaxID=104408 RepID=A0A8H3TPN3_9TREE|nr:hypothetical protein NliqN6_1270 [Naganishia liquefaciens]